VTDLVAASEELHAATGSRFILHELYRNRSAPFDVPVLDRERISYYTRSIEHKRTSAADAGTSVV
jgi:hypothetical protein